MHTYRFTARQKALPDTVPNTMKIMTEFIEEELVRFFGFVVEYDTESFRDENLLIRTEVTAYYDGRNFPASELDQDVKKKIGGRQIYPEIR